MLWRTGRRRFGVDGVQGVLSRSRRPGSSPGRTAAVVVPTTATERHARPAALLHDGAMAHSGCRRGAAWRQYWDDAAGCLPGC